MFAISVALTFLAPFLLGIWVLYKRWRAPDRTGEGNPE